MRAKKHKEVRETPTVHLPPSPVFYLFILSHLYLFLISLGENATLDAGMMYNSARKVLFVALILLVEASLRFVHSQTSMPPLFTNSERNAFCVTPSTLLQTSESDGCRVLGFLSESQRNTCFLFAHLASVSLRFSSRVFILFSIEHTLGKSHHVLCTLFILNT